MIFKEQVSAALFCFCFVLGMPPYPRPQHTPKDTPSKHTFRPVIRGQCYRIG